MSTPFRIDEDMPTAQPVRMILPRWSRRAMNDPKELPEGSGKRTRLVNCHCTSSPYPLFGHDS